MSTRDKDSAASRSPVFFKIPADWSTMSDEEKAEFAEQVVTLIETRSKS